MKRKMIAGMLGLAMMMGSTGMAMAATPPEIGWKAVPADAIVYSLTRVDAPSSDGQETDAKGEAAAAVRLTIVDGSLDPGETKEGLPVYRTTETGENEDGEMTMSMIFDILDKEEFAEVLSALGLSSEEQGELLQAYDNYAAFQGEIDNILSGLKDAGEEEVSRALEEVKKLQEKQVNPITDEMIDKAVELKLVEEYTVIYCEAVKMEMTQAAPNGSPK